MRGAYEVPNNSEAGTFGYRAGWCHYEPPTMVDSQSASFRPVRLAAWCGRYERLLPRWVNVIYWCFVAIAAGSVFYSVARIILNSQ